MYSRPSWLAEGQRVAEEGEVALFVGCLPLFDLYFERSLNVQTLEIARAAVTILNELGIEPVLVGEEVCCGHDLLWSGDREAFVALARQNAQSFAARGVKKIITTCAECCRTWRVDYPEVTEDYRPQVLHMTEFLADSGLEFCSASELRVSYQDPCRLGRHLDVVDAPRDVLRGAERVELVEMPRSGKDADCCGTSGFIHCDSDSKRLQAQRLRAAAATGASTLATACPKCLIHFHCALTEDANCGREGVDIAVTDFTVLMARLMKTTEQASASKGRTVGASS